MLGGLLLFGSLAVIGLTLGVKGLFLGRVSASKTKEITGLPARLIGLVCLLFGLAGAIGVVGALVRQTAYPH